ncbi:EAL domain-containing protein [Dietzia alimentaria]|uniref:EAL domain-containing protein n=1 Tax=Dietzia alimentaria TaxID=665550 RepID=UPI00029B3E1B|nr:EAL domain-containing protein [Dietzia alimentaria]
MAVRLEFCSGNPNPEEELVLEPCSDSGYLARHVAACYSSGFTFDPAAPGVIVVGLDLTGSFSSAYGFVEAEQIRSAGLSMLRAALGERAVALPGPVDRTLIALFDTEISDPAEVAAALLEQLSLPLPVSGHQRFVQSRVGMATALKTGTSDPDLLLRAAYAAAHQAAESGVHLHEATDSTLPQIWETSELRTAMAQAARADFEMHYQPIVDLYDARTLGYESLLRWRRGNTLLTPPAFLPAAEETSLIMPIGRAGTRAVVGQLALWNSERPSDPLFMSINYSVRQLADPSLLASIQRSLDEHAVSPSSLWVEVTERDIIDAESPAVRTIEALAAMGCVICIDDLGTGFAALRYLADLPVSVAKIDRSLVHMAADPSIRKIVSAVCDISRSLGIVTVAEGVENEDQIPVLRDIGFTHAQGYYFGRPAPAATITAR